MELNKFEQVRKDRLDKIRQLTGTDGYGRTLLNLEPIGAVRSWFEANENDYPPELPRTPDAVQKTVQGRIILLRDTGSLIFLQIRDDSGVIQIAISKKDVSALDFAMSKLLDMGDIIGVQGWLRRTKSGEVTVWAASVAIQTKSLAHPPDKHAGLKDMETRYRQRYLDMAFNDEFAKVVRKRSDFIRLLRGEFERSGYVEVETPMLHPIAGGAAARPFKTHLNALDIPLFLRIAPELYLKRLIVGGMSKVYEINRNFRNEGVDATHNPEFTALEAYAINENVLTIMGWIEVALLNVVKHFEPSGVLVYNGTEIDFNSFMVLNYVDLYRQGTGRNLFDEQDMHAANKRFESQCEGLINPKYPTFVFGYPSAISPLTKKIANQEALCYRADLFIGGMEVGTIYTEQNDPEIQFEVFNSQVDDDEERTHRTMDTDFIEALKVGMAPTGGFAFGIDRLVMLLTGNSSVRDVLAFPFMRPQVPTSSVALQD